MVIINYSLPQQLHCCVPFQGNTPSSACREERTHYSRWGSV